MANTVVTSAANTNTAMDDGTLNPDQTANRSIVHITLVCEGVTLSPDDIYDALDAEFAVVAGEKDSGAYSRGTWIFNIGPA
jgi:hypothetical protein